MSVKIETVPNSALFTDDDKPIVKQLMELNTAAREKWSDPAFKASYQRAKAKLMAIQDYTCFYCQVRDRNKENDNWHIDHIVPIDEDERHVFTERNFVLACDSCNRRKRDKPVLVKKPLTSRYSASANNYRIVHAGIDQYSQHIGIISDVFYFGRTEKGRRTIYDCALDRFALNFAADIPSGDAEFVNAALRLLVSGKSHDLIALVKGLAA